MTAHFMSIGFFILALAMVERQSTKESENISINEASPFSKNMVSKHKNFLYRYDLDTLYCVKEPERLFSTTIKLCLDCGTTFINTVLHKRACPMRCPSCCRYGYDFPCQETEKIKCHACNREFRGPECYSSHLEEGICKVVYCCKTCGATDILMKSAGGYNHECGKIFCQTCRRKHEKGNCVAMF